MPFWIGHRQLENKAATVDLQRHEIFSDILFNTHIHIFVQQMMKDFFNHSSKASTTQITKE
jgi:hypothetical protein